MVITRYMYICLYTCSCSVADINFQSMNENVPKEHVAVIKSFLNDIEKGMKAITYCPH